ncbi:hypothetical protein U0070_026745 [Myodes glareolus]|uniref:Thyroglobulin type-1 domain-containing protein n=1 Tax=Myodes glareolus TaxID=447135 RepID=A0AAW0HXL4_MYOGA
MEYVSRCVAERKYTQEQARKEFQQVFIPECNDDGTYSQVQCHSYTGYCWCVTPNGRPISGTAVAHKTPRCPGQRRLEPQWDAQNTGPETGTPQVALQTIRGSVYAGHSGSSSFLLGWTLEKHN